MLHCPFRSPYKGVEPVPRQIQLRNSRCQVKLSQHVFDPAYLVRSHFARVAFLIETLEAPMTKGPNHAISVPCIGTGAKRS